MIKQIIVIALSLLCTFGVQAQQHEHNWSIGAYGGITGYKGDLSDGFYNPNEKLANFGDNLDYISYGLSVAKQLNNGIGLRLMLGKGQFVAADRSVNWNNELQTDEEFFARGLNVETDLYDAGLYFTFNLDNGKIFNKKSFFAPYILVGGGGGKFTTYGDLKDAQGNNYIYWSDNTIRDVVEMPGVGGNIIGRDGDYETELKPLRTEGVDYDDIYYYGALGLGLKFRLGERFSLNLESIIKYTSSDYLDDVSGDYAENYTSELSAYAANPTGINLDTRGNSPDKNDWLTFHSISVHYYFGKNYEPYNPPAILIGDLYDADQEQDVNPLPMTNDTTFTPISVLPIVDINNINLSGPKEPIQMDAPDLILNSPDELKIDKLQNSDLEVEVEKEGLAQLQEYELDEKTLDQRLTDISLQDTSFSFAPLPQGIDTIYRIRTAMDSIYYTDDVKIAANLAKDIDTLTRVGDEVYVNINNKWRPEDGKDWSSYNRFLLTQQSADSLSYQPVLDNSPEYRVPDEDNTSSNIANKNKSDKDRAEGNSDGEDSEMTKVDKQAISNPVIPNTEEEEEEEEEKRKQEIAYRESLNDREVRMYNQIDSLSKTIAQMRNQQADERQRTEREVAQNMQVLRAELDSMRRAQNTMETRLSDEWREDFQLAIDEMKNQLETNRDTIVYSPQEENEKIATLRRNITDMKSDIERRDYSKKDTTNEQLLDDYRRQLWLYEIQTRNLSDNNQNRVRLEREIDNLKRELADKRSASPIVRPVVPTTPSPPYNALSDRRELEELKGDIKDMNRSLNQLKILMGAGTVLNSGSSNANRDQVKDLREEIARLNALVAAQANSGNNGNNQAQQTISTLNEEIKNLRSQIESMNNRPASPTVIAPVATPSAMELALAGKRKQLVFFNLGAFQLKPESMQVIQDVGNLMREYPQLYAELEGFTDASGNANFNFGLSGRRANAVKQFLMEVGVDPARLITIPRGEDPSSNRQFGRRVEINLKVR